MKASEWIDRVKAAKGIESDYGAAKAIGLSRQSISGYRSGKYTLDEDSSIKVAKALGVRPEAVFLDQAAERAKDQGIRSTLQSYAAELCILCKVLFMGDSENDSDKPKHSKGHRPILHIAHAH